MDLDISVLVREDLFEMSLFEDITRLIRNLDFYKYHDRKYRYL